MNAKTLAVIVGILATALLIGLSVAQPGDEVTPQDLLGVLLTRFAWIGATLSFGLWVYALRQVWRIEGSLHHLVARTLSALTLLALDAVVILIFWPSQFVPPPIELSREDIRIVVAFIIGMQLVAGLWQVTAPSQARVPREGKRYR